MQNVKMREKEHYGDEETVYDFPDGWEIDVLKQNNHDESSLTRGQIDDALDHPIGTKSITDLARGKNGRICILHDDLTRPTPAYQIVPSIIDQLHKAGIKDSQVFFLAAMGSHPTMTVEAIGRKIGSQALQKYDVRNHVVFDTRKFGSHNFVDKGFTNLGTPVTVNRLYAQSDLRIAISGLIKKGSVCGGGGKICMPGIASIEAIAYNHTQLGYARGSRGAGGGPWNARPGVMRSDMQEFARKSGLDMSINVVPNGSRQASGVYAGDVDEAWIAGVKACYEAHRTEVPNKKYDVIIANSYPQHSEGLRWCDGAEDILREGGTAVNIFMSITDAYYLTHYINEAVRGAMVQFWYQNRARQWPIKQAGHTIIYDKLMDMHKKIQFDERVEFLDNWPSVVRRLKEIHGDTASIAVFPTAALQFNPQKYPLIL